jgi:hypothetical protein
VVSSTSARLPRYSSSERPESPLYAQTAGELVQGLGGIRGRLTGTMGYFNDSERDTVRTQRSQKWASAAIRLERGILGRPGGASTPSSRRSTDDVDDDVPKGHGAVG